MFREITLSVLVAVAFVVMVHVVVIAAAAYPEAALPDPRTWFQTLFGS